MSDDACLQPIVTVEPSYPVLRLFARHGHAIAAVAGLVPALAGLAAAAAGAGWGWAVAGVLGGGFAYLLLRCLAELVHLIVDTLVPK
jgi:hypothetical protein